jgi:lycopene beta-cyclase
LRGNHVWSFFDTDLADDARWLVEPLVVHHWDSHGVRFLGGERTLPMGYNSITSARLDAVLEQTLPADMLLRGVAAVEVGAHHVTLADGRRIETGAVIDARGADSFPGLSGGWQKFVGQVVRTGPHGIDAPIIMDACVDQHDGFRFVYVLPFTPDTLFVEDTYYSDTPRLDRDGLAGRIADYLRGLGLTGQVVGEEQGFCPWWPMARLSRARGIWRAWRGSGRERGCFTR